MKRTKGKGKKRERGVSIASQKTKNKAYLEKDPYSFDDFEKWNWTKYETSDPVSIDEFIDTNRDHLWFIGTDSQQNGKHKRCTYTTVLIAYDYDHEMGCGHGGTIIRYVDRRSMIPLEALSARLTLETQRSIELCKYLENRLLYLSEEDGEDYISNIVGISIDVNAQDIHKSCRFKDALVGMVVGYGYRAFIKPEAWAAASVADKKC